MRVPSFDVTLEIKFFDAPLAACGNELVAKRIPQKMEDKNLDGIYFDSTD
jgi:hypothetical protein